MTEIQNDDGCGFTFRKLHKYPDRVAIGREGTLHSYRESENTICFMNANDGDWIPEDGQIAEWDEPLMWIDEIASDVQDIAYSRRSAMKDLAYDAARNVNRIELVNDRGRAAVVNQGYARDVKVSFQDGGRTMKVFYTEVVDAYY